MKFSQVFFCLIGLTALFTSCDPPKHLNENEDDKNKVSYEKDIRPLMLRSCTPCHFPERGHKEMMDTHQKTKDNINEILTRVQLDPSDEEFMPFKQKRQALSKNEIALFWKWKKQNMPK